MGVTSHKFFIFYWLEASPKFFSNSRVEFTKMYKYLGGGIMGPLLSLFTTTAIDISVQKMGEIGA